MLSIALSRPARATYRATCTGLGKPARHRRQGDARTAASRFLLRLGFCELALAAESLAASPCKPLASACCEQPSEIARLSALVAEGFVGSRHWDPGAAT